MRNVKVLISLCLAVAVATACGSQPEPSAGTTAPGAAPTTQVQSSSDPANECGGIGPAPSSAEVTFLSGSLVFQMQPDGSARRCLVRAERPLTLAWAAGGDRVLLGGLQTFLPSGERPMVEEQVRSPRWSRPSGKATIHISIDSKRLLKVPAEGGAPTDISFLKRHDEAVYHPAGTHIAVAGLAQDGTYGIFLATNLGKDPQPLANAETAEKISALVFEESGESLYFAADHGDRHHLHRLHVDEGRLETLAESRQPLSHITPSAQYGVVAYRQGSCENGTITQVWQADGETHDVGVIARFQEPAGWVDNRLLLITRENSCDEPGDLLLWGGTTKLLAEKVDRAAVRVAAQMPPPPPPVPGAGVA